MISVHKEQSYFYSLLCVVFRETWHRASECKSELIMKFPVTILDSCRSDYLWCAQGRDQTDSSNSDLCDQLGSIYIFFVCASSKISQWLIYIFWEEKKN